MPQFKRGDIYMCVDAYATGHEIYGNRPVIVLTPQNIIDKYNVANVVPLSTTLRKGEEHAVIKSSKFTSIAMCEQMKSVDIERLTEKLGEITEEELYAIELSVQAATGIQRNHCCSNKNELQVQLDTYKKLYDDLLTKVCQKQ